MSRSLTGTVQSALAAANVPAVVLCELDFSSGFVRLNSGGTALTWNSYTWEGIGKLGRVEVVREGESLEARGVELTLSGIPSAYVTTALTESYQGRSAQLWLAVLSADYAVLADPVPIFAGRMDNMSIAMGETANITVRCESRLADWDRPRLRRYNDADQQAEYAGDLGFAFVEQMVDKQIVWGVPAPNAVSRPMPDLSGANTPRL